MEHTKNSVTPDYEKMHHWEKYSDTLRTEYWQCVDEGLDVEGLKDLFVNISEMPESDYKERLADVIFDMIINTKSVQGYKYNEPSELCEILALRDGEKPELKMPDDKTLESKIYGAWYGRICGCLLGKTVEGVRTPELIPVLKESGNYPMHRYILRSDITDEMIAKFKFPYAKRCYADTVDCMPADDDTNYTVLYQKVIEKYGRDFTPENVAEAWLAYQPKNAYCTAERVAFCNFVKGYRPPDSAIYKNPYREWIGAQIRADYFGYINPCDTKTAAEYAWRDASVSHIKNGIYGEMWAAAMIAAAAGLDDIEQIIRAGLSEIPKTSRLYESVMHIIENYRSGMSCGDCFADIHKRWDEVWSHHWCHTISNAEIVAAALLYGENDYGKTICLSVETGFDTDCNAATAGSVLGMKNGIDSIDEYWKAPINGKVETQIFGVGIVDIDTLAKKTMDHIKNK